MIEDYQIIITEAAWAEIQAEIALWKPKPGPNATLDPGPGSVLPESVLRAAEFAVTGYADDPAGFKVINGIANDTDIDALVVQYSADIDKVWTWHNREGYSLASREYNGSHNDKLAVQKDNPIFDEDGNQIGTEPATFSTPNWGHAFSGQAQRKFSRAVDNSFDGSFG